MFLPLAIIGVDFLICFLFQWMYGDKRAATWSGGTELGVLCPPSAQGHDAGTEEQNKS